MDILFLDDSLIVVNKPSGLLTIRDGYNPDLPTVKSILEKDFGRCWIVHRLDKETSGALIVARNELSHRNLNISFGNRQIHKIYHAIISGTPPEKEFDITLPLRIDGDRRHRTVVDFENGKHATSHIEVITFYKECSLVSVKPESGYTHQIRVHLSSSGFPILGDALYRNDKSLQLNIIDRTALHASQISFIHPVSNLPNTIRADYPDDFQLALISTY